MLYLAGALTCIRTCVYIVCVCDRSRIVFGGIAACTCTVQSIWLANSPINSREFVVKIKDYEMKCDVNMYVISIC